MTAAVELARLRLPLDAHGSDLILVGDVFAERGRYVQREIPRLTSAAWTWLEWDDAFRDLADGWRRKFGSGRP